MESYSARNVKSVRNILRLPLTEIDEIDRQLKIYFLSCNKEQVDIALRYLQNVHKKYGTVDTQTIKNIIR